ncbi:MAG: hypothetical protein QG597_1576 [Actinomycetota bacterium]|jgi:hypothetical protein|nr:hypothetical protein [Actinomycetota bacterium]
MEPHLLPVFLEDEPAPSFDRQLDALRGLLDGQVTWLAPVHISAASGTTADAVVVPDMSGEAYRRLGEFLTIAVPILVVTSEFGTVSMWDWEIRDFLRRRGVATVAPTSAAELEVVVRSLGVRRRLAGATMLAYQDDLGAGKQPDIFKRFFWYEPACVEAFAERLGVTVEIRSYRELVARASAIDEGRLERAIPSQLPVSGVARRAMESAMRLKLALTDDLDGAHDVIAAGINCLNESATADTTPCLAWNLLFEERGLIWGCEADLTSMVTKFIVWEALRTPVMMSNLYPFLMGQAALKHEKIPYFPEVDQPENHVLVAHCGFFGVVPQSWATEWTLRPPVLEIVDDNSHAIDARFPEGAITLVKIASTLDTLTSVPAELLHYEQYANSDCLNGAVLRVEDGYRYVEALPSHHAILAVGDQTRRLELACSVLGLQFEQI